MAAAAGVLFLHRQSQLHYAYSSQRKYQSVVSIVTYETVYAPPATVFLQDLQFQIPTECLLTVVFPQNVHTYLACCVISIFLTCFLREAPYLNSCKQLVSLLSLHLYTPSSSFSSTPRRLQRNGDFDIKLIEGSIAPVESLSSARN